MLTSKDLDNVSVDKTQQFIEGKFLDEEMIGERGKY
jgi:hypothetical protein